ncbi:Uncharacterized protein L484_015360 [Morus notabilis]|uniref:Glutaredoxin domain-containing protein n=1 Tax=Morus notabilis TaxID=981085 RepID=W9RCA3_9ROSA|nr:uncharacterized protein At5g39865 [Morus notabilis]EXB81884.1 Uncharacterized protein L484_015360 [Morus notabilis]
MGCVSSNLLGHDDEFTQLGSSALSHHIVSLTSSTYGLLTLDPPPSNRPSPTTPPLRFTVGPTAPSPSLEPKSTPAPTPKPVRSGPEVINSWELMAGLDADSFRFSSDKENSNPNRSRILTSRNGDVSKPKASVGNPLDRFERICPPGGENRVVVYTTTLRGVRRTFEACNAVRAAIEGFGVAICERDVSMDRGFREELRELLKETAVVPPRVFVKGRYVGGAEEVLRFAEEGLLGEILEDLPKRKSGSVCDGCGDVRFLPCFQCNGSCKVIVRAEDAETSVVSRCPDCNENGLVLCPICS